MNVSFVSGMCSPACGQDISGLWKWFTARNEGSSSAAPPLKIGLRTFWVTRKVLMPKTSPNRSRRIEFRFDWSAARPEISECVAGSYASAAEESSVNARIFFMAGLLSKRPQAPDTVVVQSAADLVRALHAVVVGAQHLEDGAAVG